MNCNMCVLWVIAGIFLSLSFGAGRLGVNMAGIPGDKWPWAFAGLSGGLFILGGIKYFCFCGQNRFRSGRALFDSGPGSSACGRL